MRIGPATRPQTKLFPQNKQSSELTTQLTHLEEKAKVLEKELASVCL